MSEISRRFENFIRSQNQKLAERDYLLPQKTPQGILVGDVLITITGNLKTVESRRALLPDIYLNAAAIKIANLLALKKSMAQIQDIYRADQIYGKWFVESQNLMAMHQNLIAKKNYDKADIIWNKYQESKIKAKIARDKVIELSF
jgi:hypothetical protein